MPYFKNQTDNLCFLDDGARVPEDYTPITDEEATTRIDAYNTATAPGVPQTVTNYQGKVTLDAFQLYEEVETYINLPDTPRAAKLAWNTGAFERQGTMTLAIAGNFGLSDEQMDNMFIYAAGVV